MRLPVQSSLPGLVLALVLGCPTAAAGSALPAGLAAFTRHSAVLEARLSPRGTYLAAVTLAGGHRALKVVDLAGHKLKGTFSPGGATGVGRIEWASDERLLVELVDQEGDLAQPKSRGEIYSLGADCKGGWMVFGCRAGELVRGGGREAAWGFFLDQLRGDPPNVVIETRNMAEVGDRVVSLYKLNAVTGAKVLVIRSPMKESRFVTDEDGLPRVAWAMDEQLRPHHFYRQPSGGWEKLTELAGVHENTRPVGFSSKARTLYAVEPDGSGFAVLAISLDGGARKVLAKNELVPPSHLTFDASHRLVAVEFMQDLPVVEVVEPAHPLGRALLGLRRAYPDGEVRIVDRSADDARLLVSVYSDKDPGRFLIVDSSTLHAEEVGEVRPWVNPDEQVDLTPFHLAARDGLQIHGYVALPGGKAGSPPPLVVIPHGGPHLVRFNWEYDFEAQLLAREGFAVLLVNYRGSGGYGGAYERAGFHHWGDQIIEDVVDATRFAVKKGWADPGRMCIYGASFGAYAALEAAALEPELYRCAAGYAGVYDLERLPDREEVVASRLARGFYRTAVGEDAEALRRASPARHADRITARVFLAHGEKDERAPFEQAELMRRALAAAGRPPEWLVEPLEAHGFYDEAARERLYGRLVEFLRDSTRP